MTTRWGGSGWYLGNFGHGGPSFDGGPSLWAKNNTNGIPAARWTAPASDSYDIAASFVVSDSRGGDNFVYVTIDNVLVFADRVTGYGDTASIELSGVPIPAGKHVDFSLQWAGGVYHEVGWTRLDAEIETSIKTIHPDHGGNSGPVSVRISGGAFEDGVDIRLERSGEAGIVGSNVTPVGDAAAVLVTFDLDGRTLGSWDLVIEPPSGAPTRVVDAFLIEPAVKPNPWIDIVGFDAVRAGRAESFFVFYGNKGNVDALGVPIFVSVAPDVASLDLNSVVLDIPAPEGVTEEEIANLPSSIAHGGKRILPLLIPRIPAGATGVLEIKVGIPAGVRSAELSAHAGTPWFHDERQLAMPSLIARVIDHLKVADCVADIVFTVTGAIPAVSCVSGILELIYDRIRGAEVRDGIYSLIDVFYTLVKSCSGVNTYDTILGILAEALGLMDDGLGLANSCADAFPRSESKTKQIRVVTSVDPNAKQGPTGLGSDRKTSTETAFPYLIQFENLESATAAARDVVVTDQLDTTVFDLSTLKIEAITVGNSSFVPVDGSPNLDVQIDLRPHVPMIASAHVSVDASGLLTVRLGSIDPTTGAPPADPTEGFLPPNTNPPFGEGSIALSIRPQRRVPSGTEVVNAATIVFDDNPPIATEPWRNTVDNRVHFRCQKAIASAARRYARTRLGALQECLITASQNDDPTSATMCMAGPDVVRSTERARMRIHGAIEGSCADAMLPALAACSESIEGLAPASGAEGCLSQGYDLAIAELVEAQTAGSISGLDLTQGKCFEAVTKAGRTYFDRRMQAVERCLDARDTGRLSAESLNCASESRTAARIARTADIARRTIRGRCSNESLVAIRGCSDSLDGLLGAVGTEGCLFGTHAEATADALETVFGSN